MLVKADRAFFTSDLHFFHRAMAQMRGYDSVEEMNEALITIWNWKVTSPNSDVFILGDVTFAGTEKSISVLGQLNGRIHLIKGNHDAGMPAGVRNMFATIHDYLEIDVEEAPAVKQRIVLSHYSHRVWNKHHYGAWHLYGHSHGSLPGIGRSMDVGIDTGDFYNYETIKGLLTGKKVHTIDHHKSDSREVA